MGRSLALLIVDGHERARTALVQWLQRVPGVTVLGAIGDVATALRLVKELAPDVILFEPRTMDGAPAATLRRLAATACPVVIWTSSLVNGESETLRRAGATAVLLKDTDLLGLLHTLDTAIAFPRSDRSASET